MQAFRKVLSSSPNSLEEASRRKEHHLAQVGEVEALQGQGGGLGPCHTAWGHSSWLSGCLEPHSAGFRGVLWSHKTSRSSRGIQRHLFSMRSLSVLGHFCF